MCLALHISSSVAPLFVVAWVIRRQQWLLSVSFIVSRIPVSWFELNVLDIPAGTSLLYVTILLGERQQSALPSIYRSCVVPPVMFW